MNVKVDNFTSMKLTHEITWNNTLHFAILAFSFDGETNTKIMRILCRGLLMFPEMVLTRAPNEPSRRFHKHESLHRSPNLVLTYHGLTPFYHSVLIVYSPWLWKLREGSFDPVLTSEWVRAQADTCNYHLSSQFPDGQSAYCHITIIVIRNCTLQFLQCGIVTQVLFTAQQPGSFWLPDCGSRI